MYYGNVNISIKTIFYEKVHDYLNYLHHVIKIQEN